MATSSMALTMAEQLVPDAVWSAIQPLLPARRSHPKGGRPWNEDRAVLGGIIYVLRAGVPWRLLPAKELGCGSGVTCCRRALRRRGISPRIARRGVESSQRLGRHRWKVERSLAWLLANRRLTIRYERRADIPTAFLHLAAR
jgi:transposase